MVKQYEKGKNLSLSDSFVLADFDCQCERPSCDVTLVDDALVEGLQTLSSYGGILRVNSGYRCPAHNKEIGGATNSFHMKGQAADVSGRLMVPILLYVKAEQIPCFRDGGIGLYSSFIHVDVRGHRTRWNRNLE